MFFSKKLQKFKNIKHCFFSRKGGHSTGLYKSLSEDNLAVKKITTQSEFLKKVGILERADILSKKMTFKEKANMFYRLKRLIDPKEMGDRFKVIFAQKKGKIFSLGF